MRQTELHLSEQDRSVVQEIRSKGLHQAREVNRAHILSSLDQGIPEAQIMAVLGVGRTAVWRARAAGADRASIVDALHQALDAAPRPLT